MAKNIQITLTKDEYTWLVNTAQLAFHDNRNLRQDTAALNHDYFESQFKMLRKLSIKLEALHEKNQSN